MNGYRNSAEVAAQLAMVAGRLNRRIRPAGGGISHGTLSALATISKFGPIRLAELATKEVVSAPSITRLVADLEKRGYVSRTTDSQDRRAFLIESTASGEATLAAAREARAVLVAQLMKELHPGDLEAIATALPALEKLTKGI
jgi:DNA-binding MarR family transcriptional regulator